MPLQIDVSIIVIDLVVLLFWGGAEFSGITFDFLVEGVGAIYGIGQLP